MSNPRGDMLHTINHERSNIISDHIELMQDLWKFTGRELEIQADINHASPMLNVLIERGPIRMVREGRIMKIDYYKYLCNQLRKNKIKPSLAIVATEIIDGQTFNSQGSRLGKEQATLYDNSSNWKENMTR